MAESYLNSAWNQLFEKYSILDVVREHGNYIITAKQIKEFREPRLMTKFDHSENLPEIFKENKLSIMPISRNDFIISNHQMFSELKEINQDIIKVEFPNYIQSIVPAKITSEAIALNCAYLTGMLEDFLEDEQIVPTVSGRMASSKFSFEILNTSTKNYDEILVENSQIEIDGAYEGINYLSLVEAKRNINTDFLIRQLYYPYRLWTSKVDKKVKVIYFVYSNDIFSFFEYQFDDSNKYNSLRLIKQKNYSLEDIAITFKDITDISAKIKYVDEPEIPFPQADSFKRVINLCELINDSEVTAEKITEEFEFDPRQTQYYTRAAMYLGLIDKCSEGKHVTYKLSAIGKEIMKMKYVQRQLEFVKLILSHKVFHISFSQYLYAGRQLTKKEVVAFMKECNLYHIESEETFGRRASTIISWINWIINIVQE